MSPGVVCVRAAWARACGRGAKSRVCVCACVQVVPVERTMNKDALRYPLLLDIVLCLVTLMLGSFGILVRHHEHSASSHPSQARFFFRVSFSHLESHTHTRPNRDT